MKNQKSSHRKCQPVGVRCMRSLALFVSLLMDALLKRRMQCLEKLLCLANNKPPLPKLVEIYLNPRLIWPAIAYCSKYIHISLSILICNLGWKLGHLLMMLSPSYRDAFQREKVIYELKGWENMSPERLKAEKVRELLSSGVNSDFVNCDGLLLCVRDSYAGGCRTTEYVSLDGNWIERLVEINPESGDIFKNSNEEQNDLQLDGHIFSANVRGDLPLAAACVDWNAGERRHSACSACRRPCA